MLLEIVKYGDPVLRTPGKKIDRITDDIRGLARDMIETMRHAEGVGLAAQQVGRALQICVIEIPEEAAAPGDMLVNGLAADMSAQMPLVLINPELSFSKEKEIAQEGCLSFPEIRGEVSRPARVEVSAQNLEGQTIKFSAAGLLARAIQHEVDHLRGVLFIDRMSAAQKNRLAKAVEAIREGTIRRLQKEKARR
jgi:peptide deformylase